MDYSPKISVLQQTIQTLRDIKDMLSAAEQKVLDMEKTVCSIDESLPGEDEVKAMPAGAEKEQILHLYDLAQTAYSLIDEVLGPPDEEQEAGQAYIPEARGNAPSEISLEELLRQMHPGGKRHTS